MLDTSGISVEELPDGRLELFCADYNVDAFGGSDYECTYTFDVENTKKFREALVKKGYTGSLEEMVVAAFTKQFSVPTFIAFCHENDIAYDRSVWF